ncbi:hypothetical protein HK096_003466, partial [Nowakowskiella sp. JEL0078]
MFTPAIYPAPLPSPTLAPRGPRQVSVVNMAKIFDPQQLNIADDPVMEQWVENYARVFFDNFEKQ